MVMIAPDEFLTPELWGVGNTGPWLHDGRAATLDEAVSEADRVHAELGRWPALLLVDYHLKDGVTGLDVIGELRRHTGLSLPAVILTADHSDAVASLVEEAGHTILRKPVKPAALRALVNRILGRQAAA